MWIRWALVWAFIAGCGPSEHGVDPFDSAELWASLQSDTSDVDSDGWLASEDCDDFDATVNPASVEVCANGLDDDCDEAIDGADDDCVFDTDVPLVSSGDEDCMDGVDNDADELADCDDTDCAFHAACAVCVRSYSAHCGFEHTEYGFYGTEVNDAYTCGGSGGDKEQVYAFTALEAGEVTVTVVPESQSFGGFGGLDVGLYLMEGNCDPELCVDFSDNPGKGAAETLTFQAGWLQTFFVAVEKGTGSGSEYEIRFDCSQ